LKNSWIKNEKMMFKIHSHADKENTNRSKEDRAVTIDVLSKAYNVDFDKLLNIAEFYDYDLFQITLSILRLYGEDSELYE
jgi:hypothetical protein